MMQCDCGSEMTLEYNGILFAKTLQRIKETHLDEADLTILNNSVHDEDHKWALIEYSVSHNMEDL
jgi:hypothetical protein